ncbi:hypothetical protein CDAR_221391 [Caerostris darwini]|uniref:Uncharacterized protein n=1 Tax=Caerostris darwini TaxID=1538125 RepID=A0AAV4WP11_9ARAC|nr:hypothetical protein CDAR_221391 [Caerostris darwini]
MKYSFRLPLKSYRMNEDRTNEEKKIQGHFRRAGFGINVDLKVTRVATNHALNIASACPVFHPEINVRTFSIKYFLVDKSVLERVLGLFWEVTKCSIFSRWP